MQTDNLESFERLIFSTPSKKKLILVNLIESLVFGSATYWILRKFTSLNIDLLSLASFVIFIYLLPALISAISNQKMFEGFKGNWSFFLAAANQLIFFIFSFVILAADNIPTAWNILWVALITVFIINILVLSLTLGGNKIKQVVLASGIQPALVLLSFHMFFGQALLIPIETYLWNLGLVAVAGFLVLLLILALEYLITTNVSNISALNLTSTLIQNEKESLDLGYPCEPEVQTLEIENNDELRLAAPWAHPGPIGGFGGGDLTQNFIEKLNSGSEGFFLHVPSNHEEDLVNPEDQQKLFDALSSPDKVSKASKMIKKEMGYGELYGRRFGDQKIIFMHIYDHDDFEVSIFKETLDLKDTLIIDMHIEPESKSTEMYYGTSIAENLREELREFEKEIEDLQLYDYKAGFNVENGEKPVISLVEEVNGQRTAVTGFDYNGVPGQMLDLGEEIQEEFNHSIVFSTDTHTSLDEMSERETYEVEDARECLRKAAERVESSEIGLSMQKSEKIDLIKKDYSGLIFSINILVRFLLISILFLYIVLVFWVL